MQPFHRSHNSFAALDFADASDSSSDNSLASDSGSSDGSGPATTDWAVIAAAASTRTTGVGPSRCSADPVARWRRHGGRKSLPKWGRAPKPKSTSRWGGKPKQWAISFYGAGVVPMSADGTRVILAVERWGLDNACLSGFSGRAERGEGDKPWKIAARECEEEAKGIFGSASELEETLHRVNYFDTWGRNVRSQFRFYFPTVDESLFEPHRPDEACVCVDCHFKSIDKADCEKTDLKIIEVAELLRAYDELGSFDWENPQNNPAVFVTSLSGDLLQLRPVFTRCLPYLAKEQMRR